MFKENSITASGRTRRIRPSTARQPPTVRSIRSRRLSGGAPPGPKGRHDRVHSQRTRYATTTPSSCSWRKRGEALCCHSVWCSSSSNATESGGRRLLEGSTAAALLPTRMASIQARLPGGTGGRADRWRRAATASAWRRVGYASAESKATGNCAHFGHRRQLEIHHSDCRQGAETPDHELRIQPGDVLHHYAARPNHSAWRVANFMPMTRSRAVP